MSRICVKQLPKHATEDRLREVFSQKGEITDCKLMRTIDGKSRQFAFIGFRSEQEALESIKYFNKSYFDTSRIICEIAHKVGDPSNPQPWSRYSRSKKEKVTKKGEDVSAKSSRSDGVKGGKNRDKNSNVLEDPQIQEFLDVMKPRIKSKMWANDIVIAPTADEMSKIMEQDTAAMKENERIPMLNKLNQSKIASDSHETEKSEDVALEDASDMDYFKSKVRKDWSDSESDGDSDSNKDNASSDGDEDDDDDDDGNDDSENNGDNASDDDDDDGNDDNENNGEPPKRDGSSVSSDVKCNAVQVGEIDKENLDAEDRQLSLEDKEEVVETGRLFIRNLPYTATEDELQEHFGKYGDVLEVHLVVDKESKRSKGFGYVLYTLPESAMRALKELDKSIFQGRLLHVMPAKSKEPSIKQVTDSTMQSKTFKQKREEERKASEAGGNTKAWNSLYMRPDTVAEYIARSQGISKSDLFDRESDDLAVKVALGETKVIADTKKALSDAGVNIISLEEFASGKVNGKKRSNHVLLVKNLPFASSESELANMFGKFGSLDRVIFPPTRTLALVVFLEPSEARVAFKGLAYKRYKDTPLYLEWAPGDILATSATSENRGKTNAAVGEHDVKRMILEQQVEPIMDADIDPDRIESRSLYVKNLNFKTSDEQLRKYFTENTKGGKILSVRIAKHMKNGKNLSRGYGFIEFDSVETATNVCKTLQGTVLDGHALGLQVCHVKGSERAAKNVKKSEGSTKLHVKNIPFEATERDLRQLFSPFGQIKALRLPKRFEHISGYAFVEFVSKQEAQNARQALSNTHLYGRHLIIEWAKKDETLEDIRAKTAAKFADEQSLSGNPVKVSRKRKQMDMLDE